MGGLHISGLMGPVQTAAPAAPVRPTSKARADRQGGNLRFSRRHRSCLDQLRQFPHAHDDGPDALEMR